MKLKYILNNSELKEIQLAIPDRTNLHENLFTVETILSKVEAVERENPGTIWIVTNEKGTRINSLCRIEFANDAGNISRAEWVNSIVREQRAEMFALERSQRERLSKTPLHAGHLAYVKQSTGRTGDGNYEILREQIADVIEALTRKRLKLVPVELEEIREIEKG